MSLPKDLLEQLLSGYMDDALSDDERARVEQLLQSEPEIAAELTQLQDLRQSLQAIAQADSAIKLESGFADRVLGAAVARAHAEGLGDDHPLVRLAEQPSTTPRAATTPTSSWRLAGVLVGLAASIAIAVLALRPDPNQPQEFAGVPQPVTPDSVENPSIVPDPVPEVVTDPSPAVSEMIASSDPPATVVEDVVPESVPKVPSPTTVVPVESIAAADAKPPVAMKPAIIASGVVILNVRRSEAGRESKAVAKAMELASISPTTQKEITKQIAGFVKSNDPSADKYSVLYLQAPLKQLDVFYLNMLKDETGIKSVGITMAMDAPTLEVVENVRTDPTLVRHTSLELISENGVVDQFSEHLGQLPFAPLRSAPPSLANGPNPMGQILVLVE